MSVDPGSSAVLTTVIAAFTFTNANDPRRQIFCFCPCVMIMNFIAFLHPIPDEHIRSSCSTYAQRRLSAFLSKMAESPANNEFLRYSYLDWIFLPESPRTSNRGYRARVAGHVHLPPSIHACKVDASCNFDLVEYNHNSSLNEI